MAELTLLMVSDYGQMHRNTTLMTPEAISSGSDLATAIGWATSDLSVHNVVAGAIELRLEAGKIEGQNAVVFTRVDKRASEDDLNAVSLFGYHSLCPWGVVADEEGIHLLSSHWLKGSDWYRLPAIPWDRVDLASELLGAFTPSGVRDSEPQRRLLKHEEPTALLRAVDDALVERLDDWRERAVRFSRGAATKVDEQLQTLYAQLFVLRTIEDRGLTDTIPPALEAVLSNEEFDFEHWKTIFARAKAQIGSDLFDHDIAPNIAPHILCGLIRDLYFPRKLPGRDVRYDFSWISADVLGLAYEKYLSTILQPAPLPAQVDLFNDAQRGVERRSVRKSAGAYYTPRFLTGYLATTCVSRFFAACDDGALPRVIDFACGSGSFLVAAVDQILRHLKTRDSNRQWARALIEGGCIAGIDVDPRAVTAARLHLWQRLIEEPGALPLPNLSSVIRTGDGLDASTWGDLHTGYDIVLGNPPFLGTALVSKRENLERTYKTAKGRYDFSSLFVEQALRTLRQGGLFGMVVPNRLFLNKSAMSLRDLLSENAKIDVVVDFGATRVFDADAYVGCIVGEKCAPTTRTKPSVRVIQVRSLEPEFMTAELLSAEAGDINVKDRSVSSYSARQPGSAPWTLLSGAEQMNRVIFEKVSIQLDAIANVAQGIRTGANDIFVVDVEEDDGTSLARIINGMGEQWFVEREMLVPVVYGSEVQRYSVVYPTRRLVYAYRQNAPISESELRDRYPRVYEYFTAYQDLLSARESLRGTGASYYQIIRPRDERWLRRPKLMIRDLAPSTAFAVDPQGSAFLVAGTAVVPADPDLCVPLAAYLNSTVINNLLRQQTPSFRGDFQKFEPGVLSRIPVLRALIDDDLFCSQLSELAALRLKIEELGTRSVELESKIDDLISNAAKASGVDLID